MPAASNASSPLTTTPPKFLTLPESARFLGGDSFSTWTVRRLVWAGKLRGVRFGKSIFVAVKDLEKFADRAALGVA